ncbi:nucleotidyltransferase substrate binding protein [Thermus antranikianii]|uniref:nucleotidyltransferase substrate binding protein n=1 Tax=Thermus antranikianii TaxID=88190 RepID=UPI0003FE4598|nr:nucleotidyltransferase substrate binding protein [Thermus antranikianii]
MQKERFRERLHLFRRAVDRLANALAQPKNEFLRDSAIQRFEFTFELAWKVLKEYLELQGLEARSPKAAIRGAFQVGLLPEDPGWLEMLELRNLTSHTYDEALAERIYGELPNALERFRQLLQRLEEVEGEDT